uniref:Uncharacterized protein n=1 Tax=Amphimedon queenslandica TaxID=400682 RepID=A0A1X7VBS0_AMPQE
MLNLKFLLESYLVVQLHYCQMKEFLIVLLMSLVMGTVYFMPFHISLLGQFLSITNYIKQLLVICQTLKKNCLMVQHYIFIFTNSYFCWLG